MKNAITILLLTLHLVSCGQSKTEKETESKKDSTNIGFGSILKNMDNEKAEKEYKEFLKRRELKIKFDQKEWLKHSDDGNHKNPRWNMLSDLRENYLNKELNKTQVINLLGKPFELEKRYVESENNTLNLMLYPVGAYSGFGIDFDFLVISLDKNDKKIKVWVEQH
ncbi:hypothetical protein FHS04_002863 [Mesoflavibacter sabulilitoris]|uniref:Uncharacterized protein n=1 Tax=Mesoflavibacter zeaxanthinifaciens subsp. sabulilitoris TaxID=1520893 RepID=A0A2T1NNF8_9FLAO|nr:hypothetical protein [Mesoflavibacter zeaxanthinifaciens]MBB3125319.1 hypothetical protein [Mesoflavibacter zeaxanthinifaciens subsp. sabulilitoris]PSG94429.1 hypothetical protein C7H61_00990 [Mesoflavibacter zeaxanthinifaciens subsp. sabulilitoris]